MNITTFFYCECGYEKALNEGEEYVVTQCAHCQTLTSAEKKFQYAIICSACDNTEKVEGELSFEEQKVCSKCGLKGAIGLKDIHEDALFFVENTLVFEGNCERCRKNDWLSPEEVKFNCPFCTKLLKQKMSNYWEND